MDRATLSKPPLTLTSEILVSLHVHGTNRHIGTRYAWRTSNLKLLTMVFAASKVNFKEPTPAGEELIVRSQVVDIRDRQPRGAKSSVQVRFLLTSRCKASPEQLSTAVSIVALCMSQLHRACSMLPICL